MSNSKHNKYICFFLILCYAFNELIRILFLSQISVDGGWSSWSSWFVCLQETGERCQCRTRSCTQPEPQHNGTYCQGSHIEISRCEGKEIKFILV